MYGALYWVLLNVLEDIYDLYICGGGYLFNEKLYFAFSIFLSAFMFWLCVVVKNLLYFELLFTSFNMFIINQFCGRKFCIYWWN